MIFLLLSLTLHAKVLLDEVSVTDKATFSFNTVCDALVTHETPLIEALSGTELDCMGKKVSVAEFCEKELIQDPYYLRGYIKDQKVVCLSGKKVLFKYVCGEYCLNTATASCEAIKHKLARRLDLVHASFVKHKQLNCFYESLPLKKEILGVK
jgi:hypothetical protein